VVTTGFLHMGGSPAREREDKREQKRWCGHEYCWILFVVMRKASNRTGKSATARLKSFDGKEASTASHLVPQSDSSCFFEFSRRVQYYSWGPPPPAAPSLLPIDNLVCC
jgi:hypothetical protein